MAENTGTLNSGQAVDVATFASELLFGIGKVVGPVTAIEAIEFGTFVASRNLVVTGIGIGFLDDGSLGAATEDLAGAAGIVAGSLTAGSGLGALAAPFVGVAAAEITRSAIVTLTHSPLNQPSSSPLNQPSSPISYQQALASTTFADIEEAAGNPNAAVLANQRDFAVASRMALPGVSMSFDVGLPPGSASFNLGGGFVPPADQAAEAERQGSILDGPERVELASPHDGPGALPSQMGPGDPVSLNLNPGAAFRRATFLTRLERLRPPPPRVKFP